MVITGDAVLMISVTTALPTLGRVFNRADIASWVGTAFLLTSTVCSCSLTPSCRIPKDRDISLTCRLCSQCTAACRTYSDANPASSRHSSYSLSALWGARYRRA